MLAILAERVHDGRFLALVSDMLRAGYMEDWTWHAIYSGAPESMRISRDDQWSSGCAARR
ncbi:hypothetical protein QBA36_25165 [Streptomyces stelliscabiei]